MYWFYFNLQRYYFFLTSPFSCPIISILRQLFITLQRFNHHKKHIIMRLPDNTLLQNGRYIIKRTLGQGGFGITYLAEQGFLRKQFAIKEFFLRDLCIREEGTKMTAVTQADMVERYQTKFFKEAQIIARFDHPNIVKVTDCFQENNTVYYVMDYVEGQSLADIIRKNGPMPEPEALVYIKKVAAALDYIHAQNVNHLDLKPANIMVRKSDNEPIVIDFGVSKQYDEKKDQTSTTPPGITEGYSPMEQYRAGGVSIFSPQSDIYALGATLYKMVTGVTPPMASDVLNDGLPPFPSSVSEILAHAIEKAMNPRKIDRPVNVMAFLALLQSSENERTMIVPPPPSSSETTVITPLVTPPPPPKPFLNEQKRKIIQNLINNMVYVEGGDFMMGRQYTWLNGIGEDNKAHRVTLSSYSIGRYQVKQEEWEAVMGSNPSHFKDDKLPVEGISWEDCQIFIDKLNEITGKMFRLPTEAEWEYAARGGKMSKGYQYSGGNSVDEVAWYEANSQGRVHIVGAKKANELGLYDMSGNVWEWCQDWYADSYDMYEQTNPKGPSTGHYRVMRGGSWETIMSGCDVFYRNRSNEASQRLGLRLAL